MSKIVTVLSSKYTVSSHLNELLYSTYYLAVYTDELTSKAVQLYLDGSKPDIPNALSLLANHYIHADKDTILLLSRYNQ